MWLIQITQIHEGTNQVQRIVAPRSSPPWLAHEAGGVTFWCALAAAVRSPTPSLALLLATLAAVLTFLVLSASGLLLLHAYVAVAALVLSRKVSMQGGPTRWVLGVEAVLTWGAWAFSGFVLWLLLFAGIS